MPLVQPRLQNPGLPRRGTQGAHATCRSPYFIHHEFSHDSLQTICGRNRTSELTICATTSTAKRRPLDRTCYVSGTLGLVLNMGCLFVSRIGADVVLMPIAVYNADVLHRRSSEAFAVTSAPRHCITALMTGLTHLHPFTLSPNASVLSNCRPSLLYSSPHRHDDGTLD
ncbi:hypothetical protein BJV77DRAFT_514580 [Russula vinacea]|nr:hypothetical protein BJV77DRAFT_514580 [Russula vinacea]